MNKLKTFCKTLFYMIVTWVLYIELWILMILALVILLPTAALQGRRAARDVWEWVVIDVLGKVPSPKEALKQTKEVLKDALCKSKK